MVRFMTALVTVLAFLAVAGESLAADKNVAAAKAKAKAKACAAIDIEQTKRAAVVAAAVPAKVEIETPVRSLIPQAPRERFVVVSTTWCGPCQVLKARELPDLRKAFAVEEVDGDLVKSHGVTSYPTVIFERDGREVWRVSGYTSAETLKALAAQK